MCPFRVTRNLGEAFRSLRSLSKSIVLWIDAICMNQSDPREKTHQVGLMRMSKSSAEDVIVWLGTTDWESRIVVWFHELLRRSIHNCAKGFRSTLQPHEAEFVMRLAENDYALLRSNILASVCINWILRKVGSGLTFQSSLLPRATDRQEPTQPATARI